MRKEIVLIVLFFVFAAGAGAEADTIYFKNGRSIEGIIFSETDQVIELGVGFGTITCSKDQVDRVEHSTPEELSAITQKWDRKREELKANEEAYERDRKRRAAEYAEWVREEQEKKNRSPNEISVTRDAESKNILVEALLNSQVRAVLVLDTGASIVVLSKKLGDELGIRSVPQKKDIVTLQLAGNRKTEARLVVLKSIKIKDVEVKDVLSAILLEDSTNASFKDGLLGMTFLNQFNLKINLKDMKLSLEKLKK